MRQPDQPSSPKAAIPDWLVGMFLISALLVWHTNLLADASVRPYNIPAGSMTAAINRLAEASGIQAVFDGMSSQGLQGRYTVATALQKLLSGKGLVYNLSDDTVTIEPAKAKAESQKDILLPVVQVSADSEKDKGGEQTLPKVTVEADSAYDPDYYTDPYNKDYVLPNATAGTKTDTPIMETPLNVQAISKQVLKDQQVIRLADALKNVSGVVTTTGTGASGPILFGGSEQIITLRGFSSQTYMRNGFRLQEGSSSRELANVESIEVLKGPAAILYGQVEPGGMVNVITKKPLATQYYGFSQQFGSFDTYRSTLDATGPLTKNKDLLYRANLSYENSGSFRDFTGREDIFFAPALRWNITPKTQITFEMEYNHLHQGLDAQFVPVLPGFKMPISRNYGGYSPATTETIFGGFNWSHQFNDDWTLKHWFSVNHRSFKSPFSAQPDRAGTKQQLQVSLFGGAGRDPVLDALPDGSYVERNFLTADFQNNTTSTNLDLVGHFDTWKLKHTVLLGGDYYGLDASSSLGARLVGTGLFSFTPVNNPTESGIPLGTSVPFSKNATHTDQYGLYIQDQIKLPYDVHITGGIRYQYIHQSQSDTGVNGSTTNSSNPAQDAVTPRVGILWHPKSWLSLYANYAESFGAQANNPKTFVSRGVGKLIDPTSAAQYEGGVKLEFFDGKLRANLTYYDLTKTNVAVSDPHIDPNTGERRDCGQGPNSCSIALGEVRSRGPEIDIQGEILPGWNVIATWANTDIKVSKSSSSIDVLDGYNVGDRLVNVPRNTGSIWNTYEVQVGELKGLTVGGGVTLRDSQLAPNADGGAVAIPGYATLDLMAGYSRQIGDAKVAIQFNVNNLLDKQYLSNNVFCRESCKGDFVAFGTPRTFMGQVSVQY
jgi:iron complex outermembrane recepter protein